MYLFHLCYGTASIFKIVYCVRHDKQISSVPRPHNHKWIFLIIVLYFKLILLFFSYVNSQYVSRDGKHFMVTHLKPNFMVSISLVKRPNERKIINNLRFLLLCPLVINVLCHSEVTVTVRISDSLGRIFALTDTKTK